MKKQMEDHSVSAENLNETVEWLRGHGYETQVKVSLAERSIFSDLPPRRVVTFWLPGVQSSKTMTRAGDILRWDGHRVYFHAK